MHYCIMNVNQMSKFTVTMQGKIYQVSKFNSKCNYKEKKLNISIDTELY